MRRNREILFVSAAILAVAFRFAACAHSGPYPGARAKAIPTTILLTSPAFAPGTPIPAKYTCDGPNLSPPLKWTNVPKSARGIALICDDPDAPSGNWVHWVLYDLSPAITELLEGLPKTESLFNKRATQGTNNFKHIGYDGPCPPPGKPHRYFFRLYALDSLLHLKPGLTKQALLRAMQGHIMAEGQLMGTYKKK